MAAEGTGAQAARDLGCGWKASPSIQIAPGARVMPADLPGAGAIQHIGLTTPRSNWRRLLLRCFWEGADQSAAVVEPDPATREVYDTLYGIVRELYPATGPAAHALGGPASGGGLNTSLRPMPVGVIQSIGMVVRFRIATMRGPRKLRPAAAAWRRTQRLIVARRLPGPQRPSAGQCMLRVL